MLRLFTVTLKMASWSLPIPGTDWISSTNRSGDWSHVDKSDGLDYDNIRGITVIGDRKAIWVASDEGVSVLESNGDTALPQLPTTAR